MDGLKLCIFVILAATVAAGIKNVVQFEMDRLVEKEFSAETLWREQVFLHVPCANKVVQPTLINADTTLFRR